MGVLMVQCEHLLKAKMHNTVGLISPYQDLSNAEGRQPNKWQKCSQDSTSTDPPKLPSVRSTSDLSVSGGTCIVVHLTPGNSSRRMSHSRIF